MTMNTTPSRDFADSTGFREALSKCRGPVEQAHTLPPACYSDDSVLAAEIATIFRRAWLSLGRADRVPAPGDYQTLEIAGAPLILLRDSRGALRAFANSCRHRGARLLDGEGNCRAISCPFHCWTYRLDGRLAGAPDMEKTEGFDKADYGLIGFSVVERAGFAFLCLDRDPPDPDAWLGDFERLHAPWPLASLVSTRRRRFEAACNWKAFLEVFNEYYHLRYVHPETIDGVYARPDPADATVGAWASQFGETLGTGALLEDGQDHALPSMPGLEGRQARGARYTWVFPNMTFAAGKEALWVYEALPLGPHRCEVRQTICFPPETVGRPDFEEKSAHYYHRLDAALDEDIPALENQHRGLVSPFALPGRFSAPMEPNVAAFARWYAAELAGSA